MPGRGSDEAFGLWQHLLIEQRLLSLGGSRLRKAIMAERSQGIKTEPAFAAVLDLQGDPYQALLELGRQSNGVLLRALKRAKPPGVGS